MKNLDYFKKEYEKCMNQEQRDKVLEEAKQKLIIGDCLLFYVFIIDHLRKIIEILRIEKIN